MNNDIDSPAGFTGDAMPDPASIDHATLTDLIDEMDRAAFRRALELRDTRVTRHTNRAASNRSNDRSND